MSILSFGRRTLEFLGILQELPLTDDEKNAYIAGLRSLEEPQRFLFIHFYNNLDILDNKTNSMIQFSSVMVALYIALIGYVEGVKISLAPSVAALLLVGALFSFCSVSLFLIVEKVHWSAPEDLATEQLHARRLLDVRNKRTIRYRVGWLFSIISLWILAIAIILIANAR